MKTIEESIATAMDFNKRMRGIVFFFLLFLFAGQCLAQNAFRFGGQKPFLGMKGKVKTVTQETFELKWDNDTIVQEWQGKEVFEFTKKGELIKKTTSSDDYENMITYSQHENGRAIRFEQEIRKPSYIDKDSSRIFVIDSRNEMLVTWNNYNHDYAYIDTTLIRYYGKITEITPLSNLRRLKITETRDDQGNLVWETRSLRDKDASWHEWIYNENGLLVSENGTRPSLFGMIDDYSFFYEYKDFDKRGNWRIKIVNVKQNEYDENSDMITKRIVKRRIRYY